jgi:TPR repeat protein
MNIFHRLVLLAVLLPGLAHANNKVDTNAITAKLVASAEGGDVEAQVQLASKHYFGIQCETNYVEALAWFRKAAQAGSATAEFRVGYMLFKGQGTETNLAEAYVWLKKAEAQGDPDAGALAARFEEQLLHAVPAQPPAVIPDAQPAPEMFAWNTPAVSQDVPAERDAVEGIRSFLRTWLPAESRRTWIILGCLVAGWLMFETRRR